LAQLASKQLMDHDAIKRRLDQERRCLVRTGETVECQRELTRVQRGAVLHEIAFSSLTSANVDAIIAEQVDYHRRLGATVEWKVYAHDQPADLRERLVEHGFTIGPPEAVMVLDLEHPPGWINEDHPHAVARVTSEQQLALFRDAAEEIFGKDYEFTTSELQQAMDAGSTDHVGYIAIDAGRAVSIGRLYTHRDSHFGGLYGGGTRPSHRGRGFYRALVAARARDAMKLGARYLIVDALPTSRPILSSLGFTQISETWPCVWQPSRDE
jgi:hypothetical protein